MKLARFEYNGSSRGWWIVRDLPGIVIFKCPAGWVIDDEPTALQGPGGIGEKIWGENWKTTDLGPGFPVCRTRREAVEKLEARFFSRGKKSVLGELIE